MKEILLTFLMAYVDTWMFVVIVLGIVDIIRMRKGYMPTTIRGIVAWYDAWLGIYWDRKSKKLYLFIIPCVGIVLQYRGKVNPFKNVR